MNHDIVGRGNKEGGALFRNWFNQLSEQADQKNSVPYVFVMGSMNEILKSFDFPVVFPEVNSLQTAIRKDSANLLNQAEDYGYSPDICGYVKADLAMQLNNGEHPMGRIPKPNMAVFTNACNTYIKWAEIWERLYGIPIFTFDIPGTRADGTASAPGSEEFKAEQKYVKGQIKELIELCEKVSGQKFDIDKFKEVLGYTNRMMDAWKKVMELNATMPAVFNALTDGTVFLGVANGFRGTKEGAEFFENLLEEMMHKAAHHIGTLTEEEFRLIFIGVPCYPIFRKFNEFFTDWKGVFVHSTYLWFASGGSNLGVQYDLDNPIDSLAEGILIGVRDAMDSMFHQNNTVEKLLEPYAIDGVVFHPIKSCRTTSTGQADSRNWLSKRTGIPTLIMESDMMDERVVTPAMMKNRADAFFEGLISRKQALRA
ncbi:MAG: hypothetical protein GY808_12560 [Gammaproteobacteria bacterium]|nr:hypothetical protein [Gammaproteobacteria bacterium]